MPDLFNLDENVIASTSNRKTVFKEGFDNTVQKLEQWIQELYVSDEIP